MQQLFTERIGATDWKQAAEDVGPFVNDSRSLELWGPELFGDLVKRLKVGGMKNEE